MHSLFLLYAIVAFAYATSVSEIFFETDNQCGCYRYDMCPDKHKSACISGLSNYEDQFYLQDSASSKSPEVCSKWFLEGFTKNMTAAENGTMKITLYFSSLLIFEMDFELQLRYQNQCRDSGANSTLYSLDLNHSKQYITIKENYIDLCNKTIEVLFPYVFSGCYQLYINNITNPEASGGCMSKPFYVASLYKKASLNNLKVNQFSSYQSQSKSIKVSFNGEGLKQPKSILVQLYRKSKCVNTSNLVKEAHLTSELIYRSVLGNFSHGLNPYSTAVTLKSNIDLTLEDCAGSGNEAAKYVLVERGGCCHAIYHNSSQPRNLSYCPCRWDDDSLECKFKGIENGNYCVVMEFIDRRCVPFTLWTEPNEKPCAWRTKTIVARGQITSPIETYPSQNPSVISYLLPIFIGIALALFIALYLCKRKKKKHNLTGGSLMNLEKSCFINEESEILLLYARDCEEFMRAMMQFRIILKDCCLCNVYDPWDEEIFDKVALSIETWSLPFIKNKNTKIIVILTECSKIIEESYIDDKHSFTYRHPKAFDKIFGQSIKYLNEYFATRSDSYQRVFVVRLDEAPIINLSFHFNCATVYILPQGLQNLINDLQNGNAIKINKENTLALKTTLQEYQIFKQKHRNYLNEIVKISNNCIIKKFLKN